MTKRDDQSTEDLRKLESGQDPAGTVGTPEVKSGDEISNVDLQFMGTQRRGMDAQIDMQGSAPGEHKDLGLNKQDVASIGSMITSDPASTTPGSETSLDTAEGED